MLFATFGLPGSASTLVYNIARSLLQESRDGKLAYGVFDNLISLASFEMSCARDLLVRSHSPRQHMFDLLRMSGAKCVITTRDLAECAISLHSRILPDEVDCLKNVVRSFAAIQTALSYLPHVELRYEKHSGNPLSILEALTEHFEIKLPNHIQKNIVHYHSAEEIKRRISDRSKMAPSLAGTFAYDRETQFNESHFSTTRKGFSPQMDRNVTRMFSDFAREDLSLRIGDSMTFSTEIFAPDPKSPEGRDGPGHMVLRSVYLPRGRWGLRLTGVVSGARVLRLALCQSGVIVHQTDCASSGPLDVAFEVANLNYDDDYQVFLATEGDGELDPVQDLALGARFTRFV